MGLPGLAMGEATSLPESRVAPHATRSVLFALGLPLVLL